MFRRMGTDMKLCLRCKKKPQERSSFFCSSKCYMAYLDDIREHIAKQNEKEHGKEKTKDLQ